MQHTDTTTPPKKILIVGKKEEVRSFLITNRKKLGLTTASINSQYESTAYYNGVGIAMHLSREFHFFHLNNGAAASSVFDMHIKMKEYRAVLVLNPTDETLTRVRPAKGEILQLQYSLGTEIDIENLRQQLLRDLYGEPLKADQLPSATVKQDIPAPVSDQNNDSIYEDILRSTLTTRATAEIGSPSSNVAQAAEVNSTPSLVAQAAEPAPSHTNKFFRMKKAASRPAASEQEIELDRLDLSDNDDTSGKDTDKKSHEMDVMRPK